MSKSKPRQSVAVAANAADAAGVTTGQFHYLQSKNTAYAVQKFLWLRHCGPTLTSMWSFSPINT